jgi:hypothetical protein
MSECQKVEQANNLIGDSVGKAEADAVHEALKEVNQTRLLNSPIHARANELAPQLDAKGLYQGVWTTDDGKNAVVNQSDGKPRSLMAGDKERSETISFEPSAQASPVINSIEWNCNGKITRSSFVLDRQGQAVRNYIVLPTGIELEFDKSGKAADIRRAF